MMSNRDIGIVALVVVGILILLPLLGGMGMMGGGHMASRWHMAGPGMMNGPWSAGRWGGMYLFGGLFRLLILVGIALLVASVFRHQGMSSPGPTEAPLDIVKRRLAKGEIAREEYDALKKEVS